MAVVPSHTTVFHLSLFIREQTAIQTRQVTIYTAESRDTVLSEEKSLEDCGFMGGTQSAPRELTLYYDYNIEFKDCPILLCDHYFGRNIKPYNPTGFQAGISGASVNQLWWQFTFSFPLNVNRQDWWQCSKKSDYKVCLAPCTTQICMNILRKLISNVFACSHFHQLLFTIFTNLFSLFTLFINLF